MVKNSERIIGVARFFLLLPGAEEAVILWVNMEGKCGSST